MPISALFVYMAALAPAAFADELGSEAYIRALFPFPQEIKNIARTQQGEALPASRIAPASLPCPGRDVMAATPGQGTKKYYVDVTVSWDAAKVPGDREGSPLIDLGGRHWISTTNENVCKVAGGGRRPDGAKWCLMARTGRYLLMSDVFYCKRGDDLAFYRGFWEGAAVLRNWNTRNPMANSEEEHVLTSSLGRADSNRVVESIREFVAGPTYPMEKSRFLFFTEATAADILQIDQELARATQANGTYVRCANGIFAVRADGGCR